MTAPASRTKLGRDDAVLLVVDIQERLLAAMDPARAERVIKNTRILMQSARELGLPVIVTEQYPRGLGPTVAALAELLPEGEAALEKVQFSACQVEEVARRLAADGRRQVVLAGMETHVCVFQTARDLVAQGFQPFVARDAVLSRTQENYETGLQLMREAGATLTSTEAVVFDLLEKAGTPEFKKISALVK